MKIISRITTQKKNKDRYNIFLKNGKEEYAFSVDKEVLIRYHLHKGMKLSEEEISDFIQQDSVQKAYHRAVRYLSYRMRTAKEIERYLKNKEFNSLQIERVIEKLKNEKILDDQEYAKQFVESRIRSSMKGPLIIQEELAHKGVSENHIFQALKKYDETTQKEKAEKIIEKRLTRKSKHSFRRQLDQAKAALLRRGFYQEIIQEVVHLFQDKKSDEEEWQALHHQGDQLVRRHRKKYSDNPYELKLRIKQGLYQRGFSLSMIETYMNEITEINES